MLKKASGQVYLRQLHTHAALRDIRQIAILETPRAGVIDPVRYDFFAARREEGLDFRLHARVRRPRISEFDARGIIDNWWFQNQLADIADCVQWQLYGRPVVGYHARKGRFGWRSSERAPPRRSPDLRWTVLEVPRPGALSVDVMYHVPLVAQQPQPPLFSIVNELLGREALPYDERRHRAAVWYLPAPKN